MQTSLTTSLLDTVEGQEADAILRKCVHCGFCNATCPTYQLLGDELDGPRGRIYLVKQALEGKTVSKNTQLHLDRCLTCLACETTCPSGVEYHRLMDIGRPWVEQRVERSLPETIQRKALSWTLPYPGRFALLLQAGRLLKPVLPGKLRAAIPDSTTMAETDAGNHARKMLVLDGCVQPSLAPNINRAAVNVLSRLGISLVSAKAAGCCGALDWHLNETDKAKTWIKRNIDAWWPHIESGVEAIVMTSSGCGLMVKEYGQILSQDGDYAGKAQKVSEICKDISEILVQEDIAGTVVPGNRKRIAFHAPCSLQHGQKITGVVESVLVRCGYQLCDVPDAHLCCGSAGSYSILQKGISSRLRDDKLEKLQSDRPDAIVSMNIGCQHHLGSAAQLPVVHLVELLADDLRRD